MPNICVFSCLCMCRYKSAKIGQKRYKTDINGHGILERGSKAEAGEAFFKSGSIKELKLSKQIPQVSSFVIISPWRNFTEVVLKFIKKTILVLAIST